MHISSGKLLQMKQFNGKSNTFTIKFHRLHEQIVWVPCDPRDDQVDPNWSFVRLMKSSTSGLGLSLLVASRHDCLNSWLIPKSNRIDYKIIVLLIYLVVYLKPFRLSESCFYTSGKNHFPLNLKRKCNYFWQINHSNSVCLSNLSALIAKFSASFMYFNYIRTFPDI